MQDLKKRTWQFCLQCLGICEKLPKSKLGRTIDDQLTRSCTSVPANYRAACRSLSTKMYRSKINIVLEETDETNLWLELIIEKDLVDHKLVKPVFDESLELTKIFSAARRNAENKLKKSNTP